MDEVKRVCPHCGRELSDEFVYCPICGKKIDEEETDAPLEIPEEITVEIKEKEEQKPKKPVNKKLILIIVLVLALAALGFVLFKVLHIECKINGHVSSDWITDKEATCTEAGTRHKECTVCGEILAKGDIVALAHNFEKGKCTICGAEDPNYGKPLFSARILTGLHVRTGPGTDYSISRSLSPGDTVSVFETKESGGYTWNRISEIEWIADDGTWIERIN